MTEKDIKRIETILDQVPPELQKELRSAFAAAVERIYSPARALNEYNQMARHNPVPLLSRVLDDTARISNRIERRLKRLYDVLQPGEADPQKDL